MDKSLSFFDSLTFYLVPHTNTQPPPPPRKDTFCMIYVKVTPINHVEWILNGNPLTFRKDEDFSRSRKPLRKPLWDVSLTLFAPNYGREPVRTRSSSVLRQSFVTTSPLHRVLRLFS